MNDVRCVRAVRVLCRAEEHACSLLRKENPGERHNDDAEQHRTEAIRCYQCSSDMDAKGEDLCGAYANFDKERNVPIECNSEESHMPGTFCVKYTEQSPRGFIWDGRWRQVIRRCASVASTGVTGVCNWGVRENGVYWQECYCSEDACNAASGPVSFTTLLLMACSAVVTLFYFK
ncbi:uncharacterized protein LOC115235197 isoform X2 [Formica exsecta]|uniref:uncharacterized protein LOC115235197 isoform X2 n=1 Tax=Formica exsecta TaxID=72781 RepID=UPI0011417826|nr:uncharacterized protein LOC115235197 isoform X2 [Formica exsecta]